MPTPMMLPMINAVDWGSPSERSTGRCSASGRTDEVVDLTVVMMPSGVDMKKYFDRG